VESSIPYLSRRNVLVGGVLASAVAALEMSPLGDVLGNDHALAASATPSDTQFDIGAFLAAATTVSTSLGNVQVQFGGPAFSNFLTAKLQRKPNRADQSELQRVLAALESAYAWGPNGLFTFVMYGVPYFNRLNQNIVNAAIPKKDSDHTRSVLQEAVATGTDVVSGNGITKLRYQVPVKIENNDVLFMLRSNSQTILADVVSFFNGSNKLNGKAVTSPKFGGLLTFTGNRVMFGGVGQPITVAKANNLPFTQFLTPGQPMWMGFADQQTDASAGGTSSNPISNVTFAGGPDSHKSTAKKGDYFDNGSIAHLSHNILDMLQWFDMDTPTSAPDDDGVFTERVQYMFHAPNLTPGNTDQFTNGGGEGILPNQFRGTGYAAQTASGQGTNPDANNPGQNEHRIGHLSGLQRSSRTSSGKALHVRNDGPGYDSLDVPDGSNQPKLQFIAFVPHADFFRDMRANVAAQDLVKQFNVPDEDNGLERFITATRRQNYLCPPRRHRAFPLIELGA